MKNKEAAEWFKDRAKVMPESETKEMFRMAISALEEMERNKVPCGECNTNVAVLVFTNVVCMDGE